MVLPGLPKRSWWTGWLTPFPGRAVPQPEAPARAAQEEVVVRVLVIFLYETVVDVLDRDLGPHAIETHRLELEHHQRPGGILRKRLVDVKSDLPARAHRALHQVGGDQLVCDAFHGDTSNVSASLETLPARALRPPRPGASARRGARGSGFPSARQAASNPPASRRTPEAVPRSPPAPTPDHQRWRIGSRRLAWCRAAGDALPRSPVAP